MSHYLDVKHGKDEEKFVPRNNKNYTAIIITVSLIANTVILLLFFAPGVRYQGKIDFDYTLLPRLNAVFNSFTFVFLIMALVSIVKKNVRLHKSFILAAFTSTFLFLLSYLLFHYIAPHTSKFGGQGLIRPIYFTVLISHSILAAVIVPLALFTVVWGWTMQLTKHRRLARWTMPIWLYVSSTGVVVYLMMAPYY